MSSRSAAWSGGKGRRNTRRYLAIQAFRNAQYQLASFSKRHSALESRFQQRNDQVDIPDPFPEEAGKLAECYTDNQVWKFVKNSFPIGQQESFLF